MFNLNVKEYNTSIDDNKFNSIVVVAYGMWRLTIIMNTCCNMVLIESFKLCDVYIDYQQISATNGLIEMIIMDNYVVKLWYGILLEV